MLDDAGVEAVFERFATADPDPDWSPKGPRDPFKTLVGVVLSARTQGVNTEKAARQLFALADTPGALAALPLPEIAARIVPAGLYNQKAKGLKAMAEALVRDHGGRVPGTREGLMDLPGVGRKSADIVLRFALRHPVCAVDTHVFRVSRRLGLAASPTPDKVADELARRTPERFGMGAHLWLFRHGRDVCRGRRPRCVACLLEDLCEKNGVRDAV
ncbi:MAG: endonuclease III [Geminicoccaceae bacterium]|nr:endonuclease III [Geminicoccaceae bacterium]